MTGYTWRCRHLDALRDVLDAASSDAPDLAVPWDVLASLRLLLQSDLVAFEGIDHDRGRCYFSQVCTDDVHLFTAGAGAVPLDRSRAPVPTPPRRRNPLHAYLTDLASNRSGAASPMVMSIPDGRGRELRLLVLRASGRDYDDRDRFNLRLLLPHLEAAYRRGEELRALRAVTARQAMLMELVREGYTNAQIAHRLELAEGTVRTHLNNIYARLSVQSRTEAVRRLYGSRGPTVAVDTSTEEPGAGRA